VRAFARLSFVLGDPVGARQLFDESVASFRAQGDQSGLATSLAWRALLVERLDDFDAAWADAEAALGACPVAGDPWFRADVLHSAGHAATATGRLTEAERYFRESAALFQAAGDDWTRSLLLMDLGQAASRRGDYPAARSLHEESRTMMLAAGVGGHYFRNNGVFLGLLALQLGELERACEVFGEVVRHTRAEGLPGAGVAALHGLAVVHARVGDGDLAARLIGALERVQDEMYMAPGTAEQELRRLAAEATRAALGEAAFVQAWAEGEALSLEQATDLALAALADLTVPDEVNPATSA
jgi:tetratricopeptide (TPR) repeat protein